jgi:hypothetical protein
MPRRSELSLHRIRGESSLSAHDFGGVPTDLADQVRDMRSAGAGAIKVAVMATRLSDTLCLRDVARDGTAVVVGWRSGTAVAPAGDTLRIGMDLRRQRRRAGPAARAADGLRAAISAR